VLAGISNRIVGTRHVHDVGQSLHSLVRTTGLDFDEFHHGRRGAARADWIGYGADSHPADLLTVVFYVLAQFLGATLGILAAWGLYGQAFASPPVAFIATLPGRSGVGTAFVAEAAMSMALMFTVLLVSRHERWSRYTGVVAGMLVATFITFEAPLSGMSMNPARTLASALPSGLWHAAWIYFTAPVLGMWTAARLYNLSDPKPECARLCTHSLRFPCIHCGYAP
jgi:aquaporin Z